jgi:cob(I)alamin adenosyltransferase
MVKRSPTEGVTFLARVTTKTGDDGYTDLLGSARVPKYHPRPEAYGTVDEATSALGLARAFLGQSPVAEDVKRIQNDLYTMMAELATTPENYDKVDFKMRRDQVDRLEAWADELKGRVEIGNKFIIPGDNVAGAALDLARTIVRRCERQVAKLYHDGEIGNV